MGRDHNDKTSEKFGRLLLLCCVAKRAFKGGRTRYYCLCDCGRTNRILRASLVSGLTKSCGCLGESRRAAANTLHGFSNTKLYSIWESMKDRCYNKNKERYKDYGGRGITVCDSWLNSPEVFCLWAKDKWKPGLQIDRRDNDGNYTPSNCRFVTRSINCANQRRRRDNYSGYTGVSFDKNRGKFSGRLTSNSTNYFLGYHLTAWEAVTARNSFIKLHNLPHKIQEKI